MQERGECWMCHSYYACLDMNVAELDNFVGREHDLGTNWTKT